MNNPLPYDAFSQSIKLSKFMQKVSLEKPAASDGQNSSNVLGKRKKRSSQSSEDPDYEECGTRKRQKAASRQQSIHEALTSRKVSANKQVMEIECVDLTDEKKVVRPNRKSSQGSQDSVRNPISPRSHLSEPEPDIQIDESASTPAPNPAKNQILKHNLQTPEEGKEKAESKQTVLSSPQKLAQKLWESKKKSQAMSANSISEKQLSLPPCDANNSFMHSAPPGDGKNLQNGINLLEPFVDFDSTAREKQYYRSQMHYEGFLENSQNFINMEVLTEKVKFIAVKADLESLTKSALKDLGEGLVEIFHDILAELIAISRTSRYMNTITNLKLNEPGEERHFIAQNYKKDLDFQPAFSQFSTICTGNNYRDLVRLDSCNKLSRVKDRAFQAGQKLDQDKLVVPFQESFNQRASDTIQQLMHGNKRPKKQPKLINQDMGLERDKQSPNTGCSDLAIQHVRTHPQLPDADPSDLKELLVMESKNYYLADPAMTAMYDRKIGMRELQIWMRKNPQHLPEKLIRKMQFIAENKQ